MRRTPLIPVVAAAAFSLLGAALTAPAAHAAPDEVVLDGLVSPLSLAVAEDGTVYAAQNFAGLLTRQAPGAEEADVVYADPDGREVGAVSLHGDDITFATTGGTHKNPTAHLYRLTEGEDGYDRTTVANLYKYEKKNNPDGGVKYGLTGLKKSCKKKVPPFVKPYKGIIESHPYASTSGDGTTYLADAAGNTILGISDSGKVSTVAVLPPVAVTITEEAQQAFELPRCVRGKTYKFEFVPTDVEMGPDGNLYVTSLPGGPESPELGANGGVYMVDLPDRPLRAARTAQVVKTQGGIVSATGLAIDADGESMYVSSMFTDTIHRIPFGDGDMETFEGDAALPGDLEVADGSLYGTLTDVFNEGGEPPAGQVVRWSLVS